MAGNADRRECCGWIGWAEMAGIDADGHRVLANDVERPRVVIVGGGFGGLSAARALAGADVSITVIDRANHHLFQPLLYQVATAALSPTEIAFPIRTALRRQRNARVWLGDVTAVDLDARLVRLAEESVPYDYLVLAPGARHFYFAHPEWEANAAGLKTLEDALEIRRRVLLAFERAERERDEARRRAALTFIIVGGGPTGVELAGAIAELACRTLRHDFRSIDTQRARTMLVEAGPRILPTFPVELSERATRALQRRCVNVRTNAPVERVERGSVTIAGERVDADTVLWAAGVAAAPLTRTLGIPIDGVGRIAVNAQLRLEEHPEVFVVGDAAAVFDADSRGLPGLAAVAIQEGRFAGRTIRRLVDGRPTAPFVYRDHGIMAAIGRSYAVVATRRLQLAGRIGWWVWLLVHIARLIGFRNRTVVLVEWTWAYVTRQRGGRLILAPFAQGAASAPSAVNHTTGEPDANDSAHTSAQRSAA